MKSMLLIGMGKFGHQLCRCLAAAGNEIMIVDTNEEKMSDLLPLVTAAKIGDCSKEDVLRSFGINDFDACVVCIFDDYLAHSLEITYQLKALGARRVIAVAGTDIHEKLLRRCGADEVIFPEREAAENIRQLFAL